MKKTLLALGLAVAMLSASPEPAVPTETSSAPIPFAISSLDGGFSVTGVFQGTYRVTPRFIEVDVTAAEIHVTPPDRTPRGVAGIRFGLARPTADGKAWEPVGLVDAFTVNQRFEPGATHVLPPASFRIPIDESVDLSRHWIVVQLDLSSPARPAIPNGTTTYAHSVRRLGSRPPAASSTEPRREATAPPAVSRLAGCYAVEVGTWSDGATQSTPHHVRLHLTPNASGRMLRTTTLPEYQASWSLWEGNVRIVWAIASPGAKPSSIVFKTSPADDEMRGVSTLYPPFTTLAELAAAPKPTAATMMRRVACPPELADSVGR